MSCLVQVIHVISGHRGKCVYILPCLLVHVGIKEEMEGLLEAADGEKERDEDYEVIEERRDLVKINAPATLAQYLAKEAVFGEEIMRLCTSTGSNPRKVLPQQELLSIKTAIFKLCPLSWHDPRGFEEMIRAKCHTAIEQACDRATEAK